MFILFVQASGKQAAKSAFWKAVKERDFPVFSVLVMCGPYTSHAALERFSTREAIEMLGFDPMWASFDSAHDLMILHPFRSHS